MQRELAVVPLAAPDSSINYLYFKDASLGFRDGIHHPGANDALWICIKISLRNHTPVVRIKRSYAGFFTAFDLVMKFATRRERGLFVQ
jgi:hypothetical protein